MTREQWVSTGIGLGAVRVLAAATPRGPAQAAPGDEAVRSGAALVETRCAACHATGRTQASPVAAAPPFRDLHRRYRVADLQEALAEGLVTRHPAMPEVALEAQEVADVIAYLEYLGSPSPTPER